MGIKGRRRGRRTAKKWMVQVACRLQNLLAGKFAKASVISSKACPKLQALVYDVLPSTTAVFSYAIGSRKLSANEQFFVGAQTVVTKSDRIWRKVSESDARSVWLVQVACWLQNLQAWMFAEASVISSRVCPQPARRHAH